MSGNAATTPSVGVNSRDTEILREMHKVLFGSLAITTEHLAAFDTLVRAAGFDPKDVYRDA